jgi:hypothetical protein
MGFSMPESTPSIRRYRIPSRALITFVILTFGITWGLIAICLSSEVLGPEAL